MESTFGPIIAAGLGGMSWVDAKDSIEVIQSGAADRIDGGSQVIAGKQQETQ